MNARLPGPVKSCLFSVTTCLSLGVGESAIAQSETEGPAPRNSVATGQASSTTHTVNPAGGTPAAGDKIRQTASWQLPRQSPAPSAAQRGSNASSNANVQQELQELYRRNGREMPNMNLSEMEVQGSTPRNVPPGRHAPNAISGGNAYQPEPAKPNFFQRIFGRSGSRQNSNARPPYQQNQQGPTAARPNAGMPNSQFQPSRNAAQPSPQVFAPPVAGGSPRSVNAPAAQQFPQALNQPRQAPAGTRVPQAQGSAARPQPGSLSRTTQPVLELPNLDRGLDAGDNENLNDLDNPAPRTAAAPAIMPKRAVRQPAASPYSGLTITPGEKELSSETLPTEVTGEEEETVTESIERAPSRILSLPEDDANVRPVPSDETDGPTLPTAPASTRATIPATMPRAVDEENDLGSLKLDEEAADQKQPEEKLEIMLDEPAVERSAAPTLRPALQKAEPKEEAPIETLPQRAPRLRPSVELNEKSIPIRSVEAAETRARNAARAEFRGFRGFCPVTLRDERKLVHADPRHKFEFRGRIFTFATEEARDAFEENPERYLPAKSGADVVRLAAGEEEPEGSIENAAWYRGRLYLFSSPTSREEFFAAPSQFMSRE